MNTTLGNLILTLQEMAKTHGEDADVRIAVMGYRTSMQYTIVDIVAADESDGRGPCVYLVQSPSNEYLPDAARTAIRGED